jgi:hypothetical protein
LEIEEPIACGERASFHLHPTLPGMLGASLVRHQVVQMGAPLQTRLLAALGRMEALHHEQLPVDDVVGLIQEGAGRRHLRVFEDRIPACLLVLDPAPHALAIGRASRGGHVVGNATQPLAQRKHPQALPLPHPGQEGVES